MQRETALKHTGSMTMQPVKLPAVMLLALLVTWPPSVQAGPPVTPTSGRYDSLTLAIQDGRVSGVFSETRAGNGTGTAPQFNCIFLLQGSLQDGRAIVTTWYPGGGTIAGNLSFEGGGVSLFLRDNQDGCLMSTGDMVRQPYRARLAQLGEDWIGATLVTAEQAVLQPAPEVLARRSPSVIRDDVVAVLDLRAR